MASEGPPGSGAFSEQPPPPPGHIPDQPPAAGALADQPPSGLSAEEKQWAMFCHLSSLLGLLAGGLTFIGPLVCWLIKKDTSPFVDDQGKESLNFHLNILIYYIVSIVLACVTFGILFPLPLAVVIYGIVMPIIAGMKANQGERYRYPATFRIIP